MKKYLKKNIFYFFIITQLYLLNTDSFSQSSKERKIKFKFGKSENDSTENKKHFELSFGQNLLFISNSKQINIRQQSAIVVPTSAILFSAELRPEKTIRIPFFFNVATESKQFIVNGQIINERASPTLGAGLTIKLFQVNIDKQSKIDLEMGPLASFIFYNKNDLKIAPVIVARIKICRGENFVMYFGGNYSIGINALGILYGTGTIF